MRRLLIGAAGLGLAFAFSVAGQPYGPDRGGYGGGIVGRSMADLSRVGSYNHQDWKHFDHAQRELGKFQEQWARGHFDTHHLDEAIDELKHLAYSGRLNPRDSARLAGDIEPLRQFRAARGYYGGGTYDGYRNGMYDRGYGR